MRVILKPDPIRSLLVKVFEAALFGTVVAAVTEAAKHFITLYKGKKS